MRPKELFRTGYETSITLSSYVTKDTHAKHRQVPDLIIDEKNAFQSVGKFKLSEDLTLERIERHLVWNKKREPSSFISAFDGAGKLDALILLCYVLTVNRPCHQASTFSLHP